jgi:hypothetical protein
VQPMNVNLFHIAARVSVTPVESGIRHKDKSNKFNLDEFKNLRSENEMDGYARDRLRMLGRGSSRACYALTGSKVLKIAAKFRGIESGGAGIAQNRSEVDIYTNPKIKPICTKIFDYDPEFRWVISETVRPLSSNSEFKSMMGLDIHNFTYLAQLVLEDGTSPKYAYDQFVDEFHLNSDDPITDKDKEACRHVIEILSNLADTDLQYEDLTVIGHWGKSASGNIVLLDYGFTTGVYEEFYREQGTGT